MDKHILQDDLEGGLKLILTTQGSFIWGEVWVGIIHIIISKVNNILKNSEMRRYGHLVHAKTCIMTETKWNTKKDISLKE